MQLIHALRPAVEYCPFWQLELQALVASPVVAPICPAAQLMHCESPAVLQVPFEQCFATARVGRRLCEMALAHARAQRPGAAPPAANLCVRTVDSRENADDSWLKTSSTGWLRTFAA